MEETKKSTTQEGAELAQAAREYGNDLSHDSCEQSFLDGAKWMIDKACTILRFFFKAIDEDYDCQKFIDWFKKEMEEQQ